VHYEATKRRLGRQRGAKVARVEVARKLTEAIWNMLSRSQPFAPAGPALPLGRVTALFSSWATEASSHPT